MGQTAHSARCSSGLENGPPLPSDDLGQHSNHRYAVAVRRPADVVMAQSTIYNKLRNADTTRQPDSPTGISGRRCCYVAATAATTAASAASLLLLLLLLLLGPCYCCSCAPTAVLLRLLCTVVGASRSTIRTTWQQTVFRFVFLERTPERANSISRTTSGPQSGQHQQTPPLPAPLLLLCSRCFHIRVYLVQAEVALLLDC